MPTVAIQLRVPGCQKLQMTAEPGLAQDALQLYSCGNSGHQRVNYCSLSCILLNFFFCFLSVIMLCVVLFQNIFPIIYVLVMGGQH